MLLANVYYVLTEHTHWRNIRPSVEMRQPLCTWSWTTLTQKWPSFHTSLSRMAATGRCFLTGLRFVVVLSSPDRWLPRQYIFAVFADDALLVDDGGWPNAEALLWSSSWIVSKSRRCSENGHHQRNGKCTLFSKAFHWILKAWCLLQVIPNSSSRENYEKMFALGVTMYGQMTAGSFCYIGPQGIVHGTTVRPPQLFNLYYLLHLCFRHSMFCTTIYVVR